MTIRRLPLALALLSACGPPPAETLARQLITARKSQAALEVDGGIGRETITTAWKAGADAFAVGSAVFGVADIAAEVRELRRRCAEKA